MQETQDQSTGRSVDKSHSITQQSFVSMYQNSNMYQISMYQNSLGANNHKHNN